MTTNQKPLPPIWLAADGMTVKVIDQRRLPHELVILDLMNVDGIVAAIRDMVVRGAPLIGVTAAYGVYLALRSSSGDPDEEPLFKANCDRIRSARPTAVNLTWAVDEVAASVAAEMNPVNRIQAAEKAVQRIVAQETESCRRIGMHGVRLINDLAVAKNGKTVNILTHCNAGYLACVAHGTATAPIYAAVRAGVDVHVWVDETRPLNQGARLTAWELAQHGVAHTVVTDNAGGHLMQRGLVDLVLVGSDRTTRNGDVANKIGTYLKALAARDNRIPFYAALPSTTFDWCLDDGMQIPIEERDAQEVAHAAGFLENRIQQVRISPADSPSANPAFDVTPARLVTGLITERGICRASEADIRRLFPDLAAAEGAA